MNEFTFPFYLEIDADETGTTARLWVELDVVERVETAINFDEEFILVG